MKKRVWDRVVAVVMVAVLISGCTGTRYVEGPTTTRENGDQLSFERVVHYQINQPAWIDNPPDCVVVLPLQTGTGGSLSVKQQHQIEETFARHLSRKLRRVIGPAERERYHRSELVEWDQPDQLRRFARNQRCGHQLQITLGQMEEQYLLVWAHRTLGLQAELQQIDSGTVVWQSQHQNSDYNGGLPITPVGMAASAWQAGRFVHDEENWQVMLDRFVYRMLSRFPSV